MDFIKTSRKELKCGNETILLRGFGLGGWLLPEGYMWKLYKKCDRPRRMEEMILKLCGEEYSNYFWNRYFECYITEEDIKFIATEGFNSVRLPLNARHMYSVIDGQVCLREDTISRVDRLIEWCRRYEIYVILDMHGAPGGQTGQNIDDSEDDTPRLFIEEQKQLELIELWKLLAKRYSNEKAVAGYDLLNEPLPNWFNEYNDQVLPLYRKLIDEIRKIDENHMIILEGVHWATDFSIFDEFSVEEARNNIMLQFHKYWSNPDKESMQHLLNLQDKFNIPLFMGEGGENNCAWYTMMFPLYEKLNISWSFWSYKKMGCTNSPITFTIPKGWDQLINWIDGNCELSSTHAKEIFDNFLQSISNSSQNAEVIHALKRSVPITIPAEAFDTHDIKSEKRTGAHFRITDPVSILFKNDKIGEVDYKRYGGEEEPVDENIVISLTKDDVVSYLFHHDKGEVLIEIVADGEGIGLLSINENTFQFKIEGETTYCCSCIFDKQKRDEIKIKCLKGEIRIDTIKLT